jgi:hypothetical protein
MSKSTPISQLPTNINISNTNELVLDDDPTVQEVLSQFEQQNMSSNMGEMNSGAVSQNSGTYMQQVQSTLPQMPPQQMYQNGMGGNPADFLIPPQSGLMKYNPPSSLMQDADMKNSFLVIGIIILVQILPVETFVFKYVSIEHIPYSSLIIKAIVGGGLFFLLKKYV